MIDAPPPGPCGESHIGPNIVLGSGASLLMGTCACRESCLCRRVGRNPTDACQPITATAIDILRDVGRRDPCRVAVAWRCVVSWTRGGATAHVGNVASAAPVALLGRAFHPCSTPRVGVRRCFTARALPPE